MELVLPYKVWSEFFTYLHDTKDKPFTGYIRPYMKELEEWYANRSNN
jgi:hypothetical protein